MDSWIKTNSGRVRPEFIHKFQPKDELGVIAQLCESTRNAVEHAGIRVFDCNATLHEILRVLKRMDRRMAKMAKH